MTEICYDHRKQTRPDATVGSEIEGITDHYGYTKTTSEQEYRVCCAGTDDTYNNDSRFRRRHTLTEQYNAGNSPPVPLMIPCGYAKFAGGNDNLEAAEQMADRRMYENKRELKSNL